MKSRHTLLAALGVALLGGAVTMACTSPDRIFATNTSGTGGASTGPGTGGNTSTAAGTMSAGTGTTTTTACVDTTLCPGKDTECQKRVCSMGFCGIEFMGLGTPISAQFTGDCQQIVCDGQGSVGQLPDSTDVPDDSNPCTKDICTAGVPSHSPGAAGAMCGSGLSCNALGDCIGCMAPGECPGDDTDCKTRSCKATICGFDYKASGTQTGSQTAGDCKQNVCNGAGAVSMSFDPMDPANDGNDCTLDGCSNGSPTHMNLGAGAPCFGSDKSKTVCNDGGGVCVECITASNCKGQDTECAARTCTAGACGLAFTANGTPVALQTGGDCLKSVCDGSGGVIQAIDDSDLPQSVGPCTGNACKGGTINHPPVAAGTDCGKPKTCDGAGNCIGCMDPTQCPGQDTECQSRTCVANQCGLSFAKNGTPIAAQTPSDCKKNVCNGAGGTTVIADDTDIASDGIECTLDQCSGGSPTHPPSPVGTACAVGGTVCNGNGGCGVCTPGTSIDCGCGTKSSICCGGPLPNASSQDGLASESDGAGPVSNLPCCCFDQIKDCDMNGQWGACY